MKFTAAQIASLLEGTVEGDSSTQVYKLSKIEEGVEGSLTFLSNPKYAQYVHGTKASIVIVSNEFRTESKLQATLVRVADPYAAFTKLLGHYNQIKMNKAGKEDPHFIDPTAKIGDHHYLGAFSYVGANAVIGHRVKLYPGVFIGENVVIGDDVIIFAGSKIHSDCVIGNHCVINSNAVIGADGFGFSPDASGEYSKVPQIGNVILEDHVDVGVGTTIDRATLGSTIIRRGVKLDNQIQIAHNVEIGANTVIAAQTGIAGSTKIGENCQIGGQVGIVGHITIGNNVKIQGKSGIISPLKDNEVVQGSPSMAYNDYYKSYIHFKNLPHLVKQLNDHEQKLNHE
ncbi:MAG: UDP-3-O-(3-hydroxymyristoyl)glucosamine N-acyltransferase [Flavobacteriaceae bacterium]|jgi:UDP-3-O-[3-hydroxymyristoyl] glucosamine N-acyltransferase|nr:UDP-3-O-(3-hydroxymyristoyl)glucosamine N-acyltransferase [Flavobacteriaceae bacterium]